jgi:hypothetical protein
MLVDEVAGSNGIAMMILARENHDRSLAERPHQLGDKAFSILVDEIDRRGLAAFLHHGADGDAIRVIGLSVMKDVDRELGRVDDEFSLVAALARQQPTVRTGLLCQSGRDRPEQAEG